MAYGTYLLVVVVLFLIAVVNNVVRAVKVNGSDSNAFSVCRGKQISVGEPVEFQLENR